VATSTPLGVLVATLVCFGILAKHHELTAFKACGVSLYRLAAPILAVSFLLSGLLFSLDYYYLPETNRKQDAIRDEIKGRPVSTYLRPDRQWTAGQGDRIFYHLYFDSANKVLAGINLYDFDPKTSQLRRHISAERARWDDTRSVWVFENGWVRGIEDARVPVYYETFTTRSFPDLHEDPAYFMKEDRQHQQMNWEELRAYILDLTQSGFDTIRLQVQLHKKLAFPLMAPIIILLAVPCSIMAGTRGAASTAAAIRSGPSAAVTSAVTRAPGRAKPASAMRTIPSISGASRWVRPTSVPASSSAPSTITSITSPTSASRAAWVMGSCSSLHSRSRSAASSVGI